MFKLMGKKIFTISLLKNFLHWTYDSTFDWSLYLKKNKAIIFLLISFETSFSKILSSFEFFRTIFRTFDKQMSSCKELQITAT